MNTHEITEPLFITEEIEAEMIAAGHVFEPPAHITTFHLEEILADLPPDQRSSLNPFIEPKAGR